MAFVPVRFALVEIGNLEELVFVERTADGGDRDGQAFDEAAGHGDDGESAEIRGGDEGSESGTGAGAHFSGADSVGDNGGGVEARGREENVDVQEDIVELFLDEAADALGAQVVDSGQVEVGLEAGDLL